MCKRVATSVGSSKGLAVVFIVVDVACFIVKKVTSDRRAEFSPVSPCLRGTVERDAGGVELNYERRRSRPSALLEPTTHECA
jgi:hypothetical protein